MPQPMLFSPLEIRGVRLKNRVVVAPMHQYSAVEGFATDWHLVNAGKYAQGGAGLVIMESTKVARNGCGTVGDTGCGMTISFRRWRAAPPSSRRTARVAGIQLGHSGRKARLSRPWEGGKPLTRRRARSLRLGRLGAGGAERGAAFRAGRRRRARCRITRYAISRSNGARPPRAPPPPASICIEIHGAHGYPDPSIPVAGRQCAGPTNMAAPNSTGCGLRSRSPNASARRGRPTSRCSCGCPARTMPAGARMRACGCRGC